MLIYSKGAKSPKKTLIFRYCVVFNYDLTLHGYLQPGFNY